MKKYKFDETWCSQCGREMGPGDHGYSHCREHKPYLDLNIQSLIRRLSALEFKSDKDIRIEMYEIKKELDNFFKEWDNKDEV